MKKYYFFLLLISLFLFHPFTALAYTFDPEYIISDSEFTDRHAMNKEQVQSVLNRGFLGSHRTENWEGDVMTATDIVWNASQSYGINPKVLLVLLQKEQSLVLDDNPSQKQLDWATGYAVCDSCSMDDERVKRWKGFGKQVNSAALQFIEGYMADIQVHGTAYGLYGPDIDVEIDGEVITPKNAATAALYAYTPHFHGNKLFGTIWDDWFSVTYPTGSLLRITDADEEIVYLIQYGLKRAIRSQSALISRFNESLIVDVPASVLDNYPEGAPIDFPNYSLLKDADGKIYLLVDETLRHIDSMDTFGRIGFSIHEAIDATYEDIVHFDAGEPITIETMNPTGKLIQIGETGSLFYLENGKRHFVADPILSSIALHNTPITVSDASEISQLNEGKPILIPDGNLVKTAESNVVYIVSEERLREITSEEVFLSHGWSFDSVITVHEDLLGFHRIGDPISSVIDL